MILLSAINLDVCTVGQLIVLEFSFDFDDVSDLKVGIASSKNNERITNRQNLVEEARINSEVRPRGSSRTQTQTILSFPRISRQKNLPRLKEHLMQPVPKKNFNQECRVILWNTLPLLVLGHCVPESGGVQ